MNELGNYLLTLLGQFAGGPGPEENNLVRFGLAAILWAILFAFAWSRQRARHLPREKLLLLGFGLGLTRELFMLTQISEHIIGVNASGQESSIHQPLEHALTMAAIIAVSGAFLHYTLNNSRLSRRYMTAGALATVVALTAALLVWPRQLAANPELSFHDSWTGWQFHILLILFILGAMYYLVTQPGWLPRVVILALSLFFLSEFITLMNYGSDKAFATIMCPIANALHLLAIPVLAYVYFHEQSIEKRHAEESLQQYREHLEELVSERTAELETVNAQMRNEIHERTRTERALESLGERYQMILASAGEGICELDQKGRFAFVNLAAASMLGYRSDELVGESSHAVWMHSYADGSPYAEEVSPIYSAYRLGLKRLGDEESFWRKDGEAFPVSYIASPLLIQGRLAGAVVVFQDITERKKAEIEIAQRNARLAAQNAVAYTVSQSLDLESILNDALDTILSMQELEVGVIALRDASGEDYSIQAVRGCMSMNDLADHSAGSEFLAFISSTITLDADAQTPTIVTQRANPFPTCMKRAGIGTLIGIPLVTKGVAVGSLTVGSRYSETEQQSIVEQLTAIGQQIAMAVENARLYSAAERAGAEIDLLHRVSGRLSATLDVHAVNRSIVEQSARLLGCSSAVLLRCRKEERNCELVVGSGLGDEDRTVLNATYPSRLLFDLATDPPTLIVSDVRADRRMPTKWQNELSFSSLLCARIWQDDGAVELLLVADPVARDWQAEEVQLLERFCHRAAVAQTNARLHEQAELTAALEERHRIAANMHDGLAQVLSYMNLKTDGILDLLQDSQTQRALSELRLVQSAIDRASTDVRRSITSLQSEPEPRRSLQDSLHRISEDFAFDGEPSVEILTELGSPVYLEPDESEQVLRVVQEAVLNARRHAHAQRIWVTARIQNSAFEMRIEDDGQGFDPTASTKGSGHFGLSIMQARAAHVGGTVEIDSRPDQGTRVTLSWPNNGKPPNVSQQEIHSRESDRRFVDSRNVDRRKDLFVAAS